MELEKEKIKQYRQMKSFEKVQKQKKLSSFKKCKKKYNSSKTIKEIQEITLLNHVKRLQNSKTNKNKDILLKQEQFKSKMKDKFMFVGNKLNHYTKATISKKREKFNPSTDKPNGPVVMQDTLVRQSGKALPIWRRN